MKKRVAIIIGVIIIIVLAFISVKLFVNNDNTACIKQEALVNEDINQVIDEYTLLNKEDLFLYDSFKEYNDLTTKSKVKFVETKDSNKNVYALIVLNDGENQLAEQLVKFTMNLDENDISDYSQVWGNQKEIVDESIDEKFYKNIEDDSCDIQKDFS